MKDGQPSDLTTFNLVAAAVLTLFGLFALFYLIPAHVFINAGKEHGLTARFMPTVAVSVMTALAVFLGANVLARSVRGGAPIAEDNEENDIQGFGKRECVNALILAAGGAFNVILLQTVGFVASSAVVLAICFYFGGIRNWLLIGGLSVGPPWMISEVLWRALLIIMPPFPLF